MCRKAPTGATALTFDMRGDIADVVTHAKLYVNQFRSFGVLTPQFCHSPQAYLVALTTV